MTFASESRAFTLIEVLVSLVILSTGIVLLLGAFETSLGALVRSREMLSSDILIRQGMDNLDIWLAANPGKAPAPSDGRYTGRYRDYLWRREVTRAEPLPGMPAIGRDDPVLFEVTLTVWREGADSGVSAATYVAVRPEGQEREG
jgi:prepilin-type N-terminal cleavage/methylation domain-containing protein